MVKMRADFKVSDPDLTVYGCSSHYLSLLGCDITVKSVVNQVVEVNKYFRNRHRPNALLTACNGAVKPALPCATRWNSQIDCLQSYITNRPFMIGIVSDENNDIEANIAKIILNIHLYKEVKSHVEQLSPIAKALDNAQSDSCGIADTCQDWVALCTNEQLEPVRSKVIKRFSQAMTEAHFLANLLHPHYLGHNLSPDQKEKGMGLLESRDAKFVPLLYQLHAGTEPFPARLFTEQCKSMGPSVWYKCVKSQNTELEEFCLMAIGYMNMPASSAAVERVFSTFSHVQTKVRNRLGAQRHGKLVACFRSLRGQHDHDSW